MGKADRRFWVMLNHAEHGLGQGSGIIHGNHEAAALHQGVARHAVGSDDGDARGHGLQQDEALRLATGGQHQAIARIQQAANILLVQLAMVYHPVAQPQSLDGLPAFPARGKSARYVQFHVIAPRRKTLESLEKHVVTLARHIVGHATKPEPPRPQLGRGWKWKNPVSTILEMAVQR